MDEPLYRINEKTHMLRALLGYNSLRPIAPLHLRLRNQQTRRGKLASLKRFQRRENFQQIFDKNQIDFRLSFMNNRSPWKILALFRFFQSFENFGNGKICEKK